MRFNLKRLLYQVLISGQTPFYLDLESAFTHLLFPLNGESAKFRGNSQSLKFTTIDPFIIYSDVTTVSAMLIHSGILIMADNRPSVFQWHHNPVFMAKQQPLYLYAVSRDPETPLRKIPKAITAEGFTELTIPSGGVPSVEHIDVHVAVPYGTPLFMKNPGLATITSEDLL